MKKYVNGFFSPSRLCLCLMLSIWLWASACKSLQASEGTPTALARPYIVTATLMPGQDVASLPMLPLAVNSKLMIDHEPTAVIYKIQTQAEAYHLRELLLASGTVSRVSAQRADQ